MTVNQLVICSYQVLVVPASEVEVSWSAASVAKPTERFYINTTDCSGVDIHIFHSNRRNSEARSSNAKEWLQAKRASIQQAIR